MSSPPTYSSSVSVAFSSFMSVSGKRFGVNLLLGKVCRSSHTLVVPPPYGKDPADPSSRLLTAGADYYSDVADLS